MSATIAIRHGDDRDRLFVLDLGRRVAMTSVPEGRAVSPLFVNVAFERLVAFVYTQSHVVFIAERGGVRLGFLLLLDDWTDEVTLAKQAFVAYMAVEPEERRVGAGRALVNEATEHARRRGLPSMALMVTETNVSARGLYESTGMTTERRLMSKPL
jgi:ribosomal protein S18 acetylase RimI-like enzyme